MSEQRSVVHVVDDDDSFRTAVGRLLNAHGYAVQTYASSGEYLLERPKDLPDCLVLDLRMPGPSGLDLQQALAKADERPPIIFLSGHGDVPDSVRAMKAGAVDFLTKPVETDALISAIRTALARGTQDQALREQARTWQVRYDSLTPRERQVLSEVIAGQRNKQIAAKLEASERTVKAHRAHIMDKMRVASVAELVRQAERWQTNATVSERA